MELIVEGKGMFLGKHQGRLRVTQGKQLVKEVPLIHLQRVVVVDSGVSISSDVIHTCSNEGIPIHFMSGIGQTFASLYSAGLTGTVRTRRAQLLAYERPRGLLAVKGFIAGKLLNQSNLLRYFARSRKEALPELYEQLVQASLILRDYEAELENIKGERIDVVREQLLSLEGRAAQHYWRHIRLIIPSEIVWPGRETQGASDPLNSALNYGYGMLYFQVEQALTLAGLDAYGGFLHTDRPGKPSLVLDFIEEFRQAVVDRTILSMVNKRIVFEQDEQQRLTEATRKRIAEKIRERLEGSEMYEKKRQALRCILQSQARHLALFLREERVQYEPFVAGW